MNGALHWLVEQQQNLMYNLIMSFNLGGETVFHEVPVPKSKSYRKKIKKKQEQEEYDGGRDTLKQFCICLKNP
ncbi:hypothetical protein CFP56_032508 [Quercus suber]|uniref:Uncharacterized protein n=1 Tax=Quercus suber TaxID=58331 RepID=A0AAW0JI70_QUESU